MSVEVPVGCTCGRVRGFARDVSPRHGNRVVCYCADCQAFARFLERDDILDAHGGSDIYQLAPARLRITEGVSELRSMRLSEKGLLRWYTDCCKTPVANTVSGKLPFAGLVQPFMNHAEARSRNDVLGEPAYIHGKAAIGGVPAHAHPTAPPRLVFRIARRLLRWFVTGKGTPSPFFDPKTKAPIVGPRVLTKAERDALQIANRSRA